MQDKKNSDDRKGWGPALFASSLGITLVGFSALGLAAGHYLDRHFSTTPWLTFVLFILGTAAGIRQVYRDIKKINEDEDKDDHH
jgi:ATP synthase protein I